MAIHENVKKIISNVVFPELVKNGEYASFSEDATGRFDYVAYALKELKEGKVISPWCNDAKERIRVVICDKEYPDGFLEFDLKYLIEEVFSGTWYKDDAVNTILIVRQVDGMLDFSWIRLRDFIQRMAERCLTLRHLKNDLQMRPQCNVTLYSGHPGELFLRDVGKPDRLLLNYKAFFFENRIRDFQIALEDERLRDINLGWIGALKMPGSDLLSRQELDARLQGGFEKVVKDFISNACGQFALGNASKDSEYYSQDVFDRVVGTVASLIAHEPEIAPYDLIANLSRMIAPIPMRGWVRDVAVQYKAMLDENRREGEAIQNVVGGVSAYDCDEMEEEENYDEKEMLETMFPDGVDDGFSPSTFFDD
jgi:hypothetical protein